jgi:hypothetical protein
MYLVEFESRVIVFIRWGFQYLTFSRGARLITGPETRVEQQNLGEDEFARTGSAR